MHCENFDSSMSFNVTMAFNVRRVAARRHVLLARWITRSVLRSAHDTSRLMWVYLGQFPSRDVQLTVLRLPNHARIGH